MGVHNRQTDKQRHKGVDSADNCHIAVAGDQKRVKVRRSEHKPVSVFEIRNNRANINPDRYAPLRHTTHMARCV